MNTKKICAGILATIICFSVTGCSKAKQEPIASVPTYVTEDGLDTRTPVEPSEVEIKNVGATTIITGDWMPSDVAGIITASSRVTSVELEANISFISFNETVYGRFIETGNKDTEIENTTESESKEKQQEAILNSVTPENVFSVEGGIKENNPIDENPVLVTPASEESENANTEIEKAEDITQSEIKEPNINSESEKTTEIIENEDVEKTPLVDFENKTLTEVAEIMESSIFNSLSTIALTPLKSYEYEIEQEVTYNGIPMISVSYKCTSQSGVKYLGEGYCFVGVDEKTGEKQACAAVLSYKDLKEKESSSNSSVPSSSSTSINTSDDIEFLKESFARIIQNIKIK